MNALTFKYAIRSELPLGPESPAAIGAKFLNMLDALHRIDPTIFTNWEIMDYPARDSLPLAAARQRIAAIIEKNVTRNDLGEPRPNQGYTAGSFTGDVPASRRIYLRVHAGGVLGTIERGVWLQTGEWNVPPDPAIVAFSIFKAAMLAINADWPPVWACGYAFRLDYDKAPLIPGAPLFPYSMFHIPWLAYLSAPLAVGVNLPAEIKTERSPDGSLLMIATEDRLDPSNAEHLRRARIIADILILRTDYERRYGKRRG
jgi:hypothetical protein